MLTEGVLTRRLQNDPELPGVAAVLFDEVHERNLTTDLGLALTLDVAATLRPDLRIVAMSATADTASFAGLLATDDGGPAPIIVSEGRTHPIDLRWLPRQRNDRLEQAVASAVERALRDDEGDVLVFLPGIGEITRVRERLAASIPPHVDVRPLAGALSLEDQDLALAPSPPGRRRVVLATDIAETSLTVEGVRVVVDGGLAREPRFDSGTGMTRLTTVSISRDSADQRAGRAGRTEPGVAYRLWSKIEHGSRPAHRPAEIESVDLAGLALELAAWGTTPDRLSFADPPPPRTWRQGVELLTMLGALDGDGRLTELGKVMVKLPLHPRLARIVAGAPMSAACVIAAVVDERDVMRRSRLADQPAASTSFRPTSRCASRSCAGTSPTTGPIAAACGESATAPPTSPGGSASASTPTPSIPTAPGCSCSPGSPIDSPPVAVPASSRCAPAPARGSPTAIRSRRPTSSSPPMSTASGRALASGSVPQSRRSRSPGCSTTSSRTAGSCGTPTATTSSCGSSDGSTRCASARRCALPDPGDETLDALIARVRNTKLAVLSWPDAGGAAAGTRRPAA